MVGKVGDKLNDISNLAKRNPSLTYETTFGGTLPYHDPSMAHHRPESTDGLSLYSKNQAEIHYLEEIRFSVNPIPRHGFHSF